MVQIYAVGNENFTNNGDAVLICFSCDLSVELNGTWVLNLEVPIDEEGRWKLITENAVLKVPTWQENEQLYRISNYTKTESGVSAVAYPIFYDSAKDAFLMDCRPTNKNGQEALDIMLANTPYSGRSDIDKKRTAYFVRRNVLDAICGNDEPTFLQRWGGEILYDNYKIIINKRVGGDYGVEARYGKNIEGISYTVDMTDVVTRIVPIAYNGKMLSGETKYVDSPNIGAYPIVYTKEVSYDWIKMAEDSGSGDDDTVIICNDQAELDAALQSAAEADFANGCDAPAITMDINMAMLRDNARHRSDVAVLTDTDDEPILDTDSDEIETFYYRDFASLEKVLLGDTVHCRHKKLDITSDARVIAMTWDCLQKTVKHVTLGSYKYNYISAVNSAVQRANAVIRDDGTVMAEKVQGFLNGQNTVFRAQYDLATHMDTMAILFENLDAESPMYGALGIGTQGLCISKTRTEDGRDWVWTTGATANGLNAEMGVFGIIADKQGYNYINMDTGEAHIGNNTNYIYFNPETGQITMDVAEMQINGTSVADSIGDAAKTATNYLKYTANDGLVVKMDASTDTGYNTQIKSDGIYFRDGSSVLAKIDGNSYTINQIGNTALPAMMLDSTGLSFYKTGTSTVAAKYTAEGFEVETGKIGGANGFTIDANKIYNGTNSMRSTSAGVYVGTDGINLGGGEFTVTKDGLLRANNAYIGRWGLLDPGVSSHNAYTFAGSHHEGINDNWCTILRIPSSEDSWAFQVSKTLNGSWTDTAHITAKGVFYGTAGFMTSISDYGYPTGVLENSGKSGIQIEHGGVSVIPRWGGSKDTGSRVYMGSTSTPFNTFYATNTTIHTSDRSCKKDIAPFTEAHEKAYMELEPITYKWTMEGHDRRHFGLIAQDVESVFSKYGITTEECGLICSDATEDGTKKYALRYGELITLNVHMIQKLFARIEELERRLADGNL